MADEDDDLKYTKNHNTDGVGEMDDCWEVRRQVNPNAPFEVIAYVNTETMADAVLGIVTMTSGPFEEGQEY